MRRTAAGDHETPLPGTSSSTLGNASKIEMSFGGEEGGVAAPVDVEKVLDSEVAVPVTGNHYNYAGDLVGFDGPNDPENPQNWSKRKKWGVTASMGGMTFVVTFSSSIFVRASSRVDAE
jgi:hypothetical protein